MKVIFGSVVGPETYNDEDRSKISEILLDHNFPQKKREESEEVRKVIIEILRLLCGSKDSCKKLVDMGVF